MDIIQNIAEFVVGFLGWLGVVVPQTGPEKAREVFVVAVIFGIALAIVL